MLVLVSGMQNYEDFVAQICKAYQGKAPLPKVCNSSASAKKKVLKLQVSYGEAFHHWKSTYLTMLDLSLCFRLRVINKIIFVRPIIPLINTATSTIYSHSKTQHSNNFSVKIIQNYLISKQNPNKNQTRILDNSRNS